MAEFLRINTTENDAIIRWINLDAVMYVVNTKNQQGNKLNIKFIDSTNLTIDGKLNKELKLALDILSVNDRLPDDQDIYSWAGDRDSTDIDQIEAMREADNDDYLDNDRDDY
jgi:hypothetical protein